MVVRHDDDASNKKKTSNKNKNKKKQGSHTTDRSVMGIGRFNEKSMVYQWRLMTMPSYRTNYPSVLGRFETITQSKIDIIAVVSHRAVRQRSIDWIYRVPVP